MQVCFSASFSITKDEKQKVFTTVQVLSTSSKPVLVSEKIYKAVFSTVEVW